jgi:hypothetical protein
MGNYLKKLYWSEKTFEELVQDIHKFRKPLIYKYFDDIGEYKI